MIPDCSGSETHCRCGATGCPAVCGTQMSRPTTWAAAKKPKYRAVAENRKERRKRKALEKGNPAQTGWNQPRSWIRP